MIPRKNSCAFCWLGITVLVVLIGTFCPPSKGVNAFVPLSSSSSSSSKLWMAVNGNNDDKNNVDDDATTTATRTTTTTTSTTRSSSSSSSSSYLSFLNTTTTTDFTVTEIPTLLSRMATDVLRKVRWGDKMTPATSASLYMNPATQRLATNLTVSWEPHVADMIQALQRVKAKPAGQPLLVGVVGIPGSGKSTSCDLLASYLDSERTLVMPMDGYHLSMEQLAAMSDPADVIYRRGAPDTFDPASLLRDLHRITGSTTTTTTTAEATVSIPGFDHAVGDPQPHQHTFVRDQHDIVIVEGIYLMHQADGWQDVKPLLDFCIYIQADVDVCIERLKIRNQCIPGYTPEEIEVRCEAVDRVNAETVLRSATLASLSVPSSAMKAPVPTTPQPEECDFVTEQEMEQYVETVKEGAEAIIQDL